MADPLFPNPSEADDADPAEWIVRQRQSAQMSAIQGLEGNPEDGARALELGKATGADPALIHGDLENFEKQHKAALTAHLLSNNQFLRDYANSQPLAPVVSANDWGQLDSVSQHLQNLVGERAGQILGAPSDMASSAAKAFYDEWTKPLPEDFWKVRPQDVDFAEKYPAIYQNLAGLKQLFGLTGEAFDRTFAGVLAGGGAAIETGAKAFGMSPERAADLKETALGTAETLMQMGMTGEIPHIVPGEPKLDPKIKELVDTVRPFAENGDKPPVGVHPEIDKLYGEQAKLDMKNLQELEREADKSATKELSPEEFANFVRSHGEATVSVDAEAVRKLYGDKQPTPDDKILGHVDGLAQQLAAAETYGGRVEVPLADWLAHTDPEVRKALKDDISVRKGGVTLNEAKGPELPEGAEKPEEKPPPIDIVEAIQRSAGLDPIAPGQTRLVRVAPEEGDVGHTFDIEDGQGRRVGGATVEEREDGKFLYVTSVAGGTPEGLPGFFGTRQMYSLIRQLAQEFPHATEVGGFRPTGARGAAGAEGEMRIPLRPTPKQITDFMREGFEPRVVRDLDGNAAKVQPLYSTTLKEVLPPDILKTAKVTDSPIMHYFADKTLEHGGDTPVHILSVKDMERVAGNAAGLHQLFLNGKSEIFLPADVSEWSPEKAAHIIMHEGGHAVTSRQIVDNPDIAAKIRALMDHVEGQLYEKHSYAFTNEREFIAEGRSKESLQEDLKNIRLDAALAEHLGLRPTDTVWGAIKAIVKELWERITGKPVPETAMDAFFKISADIEEVGKPIGERRKKGVFEGGPERTDLAPPRGEPGEAKQQVIGVKETSKDVWRVTYDGTVLGDSRGRSKVQAIEEARKIVERQNSQGGVWEGLTFVKMKTVLDEELGVGRTDFGPPREKQLELPGLTRMEDREAFDKAMSIGLTVKQWRQYKEDIAKRDEQDMAHFREQAERRERLRQTTEWKTEEKRIREEVKNTLMNRPDIAADNFLREGIAFGDKLKGRPRLNSDKLTAEQKAGLPDDYHKAGGINPDDAATMFGHGSVDEMIQSIKQLHAERGELGPNEHINKLAERATQDRMAREFGNLQQNILEEAKDHVINRTQIDLIDQELLALATKFGGKTELPITKGNLDAWVKKQFAEMPISMHDKDTYLASAGRAGRMAELLRQEDPREALKYKEKQSIALRMANEAKKYEKERAAFDAIAKRVRDPKYDKMDNKYLAHLRDQLQNAGLRTGKSVQGLAEDVEAAGKLSDFVKSESDMKHIQFLLPDWIYAGEKIPLDKMTYEQFKGFSDTVKQLYTLGRDDKSFLTRSGKAALRDTIDNEAIPQLEKQGTTGTPYNVEGIGKLTQGVKEIVYGKLIQNFSVFNRWDLGDRRGFFNMNVTYPAAAAASELSARIKVYSRKLEEAFKPIEKLDLRTKLPDLLSRVSRNEKVNMTMENAQRIIMDMGNPSNRDKFIRGWNTDLEKVWGWLARNTTKEMWDTWQAVGDLNAEIFSDLKEMIRDQNGVVPDTVELVPFTDPHGVQRKGWYSPMIYDQKELGASRAADRLPEINPTELGGLFETGFLKSTTATGSEIRRTSYAAPTDLTLNRLPQRMSQILYDTSFRPFVINFGKMLRDTEFRHAIERHSGEPVLHMMDDWLRDLVGGSKGVSTVSDQTLGSVTEFFRRNLIGSLIGWNVHTAEKHGLTAAITSLAEVGPVNFAREVKSLFATSPDGFKSNFNFAIDKSLELQRRSQNWRESLGGQFEGLRFKDKGFWAARNWMLEKGSFLVTWSDMLSAVPSWLAEYKKQMDSLGKEFPDKLPQEYEGTAIEIADSIVRRAHGSTAVTSRPGAMRGGPVGRLFTSLYSVFNQMLQRNFEAYWRTKYALENYKDRDNMEGTISGHLGKAALLVATSSLWPVLVEHFVTPDPDKKKESWAGKVGEYLAEGASLGIPVAREVVHGFLTSGEAGAGMLDTGLKELSSSFADILKGTSAMDKEHGGKTIKDFTNVIGMATGAPGEAGNILETMWNAAHNAKQAPRSPAETYRAVTTGKAIGEPDPIQRVIIEPFTKQGRRK